VSALEDFKAFDVAGGALSLWTFRKSQRQGAAVPTYAGHWVGITESLEHALKAAIMAALDQITETIEYELLAQNNEGSALTLTTLETNAGLVIDAAKDELPAKKARKLKDLQNTEFYTVKIESNGEVLHAICRANDSWKTKKFTGLLPVVFSDDELELEDSPAFSLSKHFDFFVLADHVLISSKAAEHRLPEQPCQCVPTVLAGARVGERLACHRGQSECVVKFAVCQQSRIGRDQGPAKLHPARSGSQYQRESLPALSGERRACRHR